jgi:hypothetical protein
MLSHVKNSMAGRKAWEAVTDDTFRVTFIPPAGVLGSEILTEQCISCTGWKTPGPETTTQQYQQARRLQASADVDDTQTCLISFLLKKQ